MTPTRMQVPMARPDITDAEIEAVNAVLRTPFLSIGPRIDEFERAAAANAGSRHAAGVANGTCGLHLCVIAAGVEAGDVVITSPFSFVASSNVVLYERAVPVFVDIDPDTLNIDPALVAQAASDITNGGLQADQWLPPALRGAKRPTGRLKALLPVHAFGQPPDMDPILAVAKEHGLFVIEDSCEAIGAEYKGRKAGTMGDAGVFAFYPNKQMTTGEGGVVVTDRAEWDTVFRSLRNQGRDVFDAWLNHTRLGYNYRLDELSAALGIAQIARLEELLNKRERVAQLYNARLAAVERVRAPYVASSTTRMSWFVYVVRLDPSVDRDAVMAELAARGVPSRPYFTPIHLQPFYRERFSCAEGDFPITEAAGRSCLALPFFGTMSEQQVDYVSEQLAAVLD